MSFEEELKQRTEAADKIVCSFLPAGESPQRTIFEAMDYSVTAGGKRLRPIIMKEFCSLFDRESPELEYFMAAIEMIHTSSLVHDDLPAMDADRLRRGKPTTWVVYGDDIAILAGDALMIYAFEVAAKAFECTDSAALTGRCIGVLAQKTGIYGMIGGQTVDVELTGKSIQADTLDFIYRLKTGALLETSAMIGAMLGGADEREVMTAQRIAEDIGMAFQIRDDILDVTGTEEVLGKNVLSDQKNDKTTYVTLYGMEEAERLVAFYLDRAMDALEGLGKENRFLGELLRWLINRDN